LRFVMQQDYLKQLYLLQLADTALPIGATAHSFGLETLVADNHLTVAQLPAFFADYIMEVGRSESLFCRVAHQLSQVQPETAFETDWLALNSRLSALKLARESRVASALLGKRLLQLVYSLEPYPRLEQALQAADIEPHHATAFGLVGGIWEVDEELTVLAYLQQSVAALISVCQRLLPLGQKQAVQLLWQLKPTILAAAVEGRDADLEGPAAYTCTPLLDLAGMRHPDLATRLFIS
jgi:urease accessory protein